VGSPAASQNRLVEQAVLAIASVTQSRKRTAGWADAIVASVAPGSGICTFTKAKSRCRVSIL